MHSACSFSTTVCWSVEINQSLKYAALCDFLIKRVHVHLFLCFLFRFMKHSLLVVQVFCVCSAFHPLSCLLYHSSTKRTNGCSQQTGFSCSAAHQKRSLSHRCGRTRAVLIRFIPKRPEMMGSSRRQDANCCTNSEYTRRIGPILILSILIACVTVHHVMVFGVKMKVWRISFSFTVSALHLSMIIVV